MTVLLMMGLVVFMAWAAWFEIDETVRAQGQVIPGGRTQVIQSVDGGVLSGVGRVGAGSLQRFV
jgi:membrane fusion protein, adhesin transport system